MKKSAAKKDSIQRIPVKNSPAGLDFLAHGTGDTTPTRIVDLSLDTGSRPLAGADIVTYVEQHRLERLQVVEALAMASPGTFSKLVKSKNVELPFQIELLLRYYMKQPVRPRKLLPIDVFNAVYGDLLQRFKPENVDAAKIMLYERFAAMLGRTVYSAYRWFKRNDTNNYGVANGPLRRLFAQLSEDPVLMRAELEDLARTAYRVRGQDFDALFPLPDVKTPPLSRRPGTYVLNGAQDATREGVPPAVVHSPKDYGSKRVSTTNPPLKAATPKSLVKPARRSKLPKKDGAHL